MTKTIMTTSLVSRQTMQRLINRGYKGIDEKGLKGWTGKYLIRTRKCGRCRGNALVYRRMRDGSRLLDLCPVCGGKGFTLRKVA